EMAEARGEVFLRAPGDVATSPALAGQLLLQRRVRGIERKARRLAEPAGVRRRPPRDLYSQRAADAEPALGAGLVGKTDAGRGGAQSAPIRRRRHLALDEGPQGVVLRDAFHDERHLDPPVNGRPSV